MPVRADGAVQLSRWNAEPVRARSFVLATMAVVVEGKAKEPPATVDCPSLTNATPLLAEHDNAQWPV